MKGMIQNLMGRWTAAFGLPGASRKEVDPFAHVEVPRYPPLNEGLPPVSVDRLLGTQEELIRELRDVLSLTPEDFDRLFLPVIRNMAAFVHLLPASEHHHHNGAGGLFHHSLDVGFRAARLTKDKIFERTATPRVRNRMEPRWRVATGLAGLLHDIGKPQTDVIVVDRTGDLQWQPFTESLLVWSRRNNLDRYFPRFVDERHRVHQVMAPVMLDLVITSELRLWLTEFGNGPAAAVVGAITGNTTHHMVTYLVNQADKASVAVDLKKRGASIDGLGIGVPAHGYLVDAMRRLIAEKRWRVNEAGGCVWMLDDGAYIVWNRAGKEIVELLRSENVPGIPGAIDTLADILIERGFAVPRLKDGGIMYRYWPVLPHVLQERGLRRPLLMLRLANPESVFRTTPPRPIEAVIGDAADDLLRVTVKDAEGDEDDEPTLIPLTAGATTAVVVNGLTGATKDQPQGAGGGEASRNLGAAAGQAPAAPSGKAGAAALASGTPKAPQVVDAGGADFLGNIADLEKLWAEAGEGAAGKTVAPVVKDEDVKHARVTLEGLGLAGRILLAMADDAQNERVPWATIFARRGRRVGIVYPDGFSGYAGIERDGFEPRSAMEMLSEFEAAKAVEPNPRATGRFVQRLGETNAIVLRPEYAKAVRKIASVIDAEPPASEAVQELVGPEANGLSETDTVIAAEFLRWAIRNAGKINSVARESGMIRVGADKLGEFSRPANLAVMRVRAVILASGWVQQPGVGFVYYERDGADGTV